MRFARLGIAAVALATVLTVLLAPSGAASPSAAGDRNGEGNPGPMQANSAAPARYTAHPPRISKGVVTGTASVTNASRPVRICVQIWFVSPPKWPQGPVSDRHCSKRYYTTGRAWTKTTCLVHGLYWVKAGFWNKSGKRVASRQSKYVRGCQ